MLDLRTARRNYYPGWLGSTDFLLSLSSKPANEGVDYSKQVEVCNLLELHRTLVVLFQCR